MASARTSYHHGDLRQHLIQYALDVIRSDGQKGFSLRAAARAQDVDASAVYRHFRNKRALLDAVVEAVFVRLADRMEEGLEGVVAPADRFRAVGLAYVEFATAEPAWFALAFGPEGAGAPGGAIRGVGSAGRDPHAILMEVLTGLSDANLSSMSPEDASPLAWSMMHGIAHLVIEGHLDPLGAPDVVRRATSLLLLGWQHA